MSNTKMDPLYGVIYVLLALVFIASIMFSLNNIESEQTVINRNIPIFIQLSKEEVTPKNCEALGKALKEINRYHDVSRIASNVTQEKQNECFLKYPDSLLKKPF